MSSLAILKGELPSEIAKALRTERERRGLSQAKFADLIGVPLSTYAKWENMKDREPDNQGLIRIALRCLSEHGEAWTAAPPKKAKERK